MTTHCARSGPTGSGAVDAVELYWRPGWGCRLADGKCPYYACIPTAMMVRASDASAKAAALTDSPVPPRSTPTGQRWPGASAKKPLPTGTTPTIIEPEPEHRAR